MERFKRLDGPNRTSRGSSTLYRGALGCINIFLVGVGVFLIGIASYGKNHIQLVTFPAIVGILASGIILILLSILGLIGILRRNQVILFVYMILMVLLFVILLSFSIAALSLSNSHQHALIKTAWSASNEEQKNHIETMLNCCGLMKGDAREMWCRLTYNVTNPCYEKLEEPIAKGTQCSGGLGLFVSLMLLVAVFAAIKHRDLMREPGIVDGNVFL